ncbi:MAG TPA: DDE-type integrase/transposase/recombinase [Bryobacteraceae bacterium]|nr:DDE-type integrase/transposase/recombinase [Bryobacteraceae bacterium]
MPEDLSLRTLELVQWDTSEHDWLEGRGGKLYLIAMIDDATGELSARFAAHDSTEENMRLLRSDLENNGRPVAFYTDKASRLSSISSRSSCPGGIRV